MPDCIFSVDVEDWFHILDLPAAPRQGEWESLPSRVDRNFRRLLDLMGEHGVRGTCFFLGWVARQYPHLVRLAAGMGHEIASHGYAHRLAFELGASEFRRDAELARRVIGDAGRCEVAGYRAAGFSATERTPWFFEELAAAGYRYDSSVFPAVRGHGGMPGAACAPYVVSTPSGDLAEFPVSVTDLFGQRVCLFGGGYLRLAPWRLVLFGARRVLAQGRPVVFYVHPREIDPGQPRLPMNPLRRFKSYVNLSGTEAKVHRIFSEFEFATFSDLLARNNASREVQAAK